MTQGILLGLAMLVVVFAIAIYNRLVNLKNRFKQAFDPINGQLQRRHDLVPNLVERARHGLPQERETLNQLMEARNQAASAREAVQHQPDDARTMAQLNQAESMLSASLASFLARHGHDPALTTDEEINELVEELTSTDNRIGFARQAFNDAVMNYNTYREQFPNNIVANLLGNFQEAELLRIDAP
jgi:LemA protein